MGNRFREHLITEIIGEIKNTYQNYLTGRVSANFRNRCDRQRFLNDFDWLEFDEVKYKSTWINLYLYSIHKILLN